MRFSVMHIGRKSLKYGQNEIIITMLTLPHGLV